MTTSLAQQLSLFDISSGPVCQKCQLEIGSKPSFEAAGFTWHATGCFTCSCCSKDITDSFVEKYNRIFCLECDRNLFGHYCGEKIGVHTRESGCGELITAEFLQAGGHLFHPSCLACNKCKQSSPTGELFLYQEQFLCGKCTRLVKK